MTMLLADAEIPEDIPKDFVGGDFARAGRSHNLVGWAVSSREHLDDKLFCISLSTRK
jgi:hypothetical protein